jgi:hypothetical protein
MPLTEEQRAEVLRELKDTRDVLAGIPDRLKDVEQKGQHTRWAVLVVALLLLLGGMAFLLHESRANNAQNDRFEEFAYCQAQYNQTNADISKIRAVLSTRYNTNTAKLIVSVGKIVAQRKGDINKAFGTYNKELAAIETERANNPLPAYPDCYNKYIRQSVPSSPQAR